MKKHSSRPLDLDTFIAHAPKFGHYKEHEEGTAKIRRWLALADLMLDADLQQLSVDQHLRFEPV
ncbi:MAG TPA: hypothetical protein VI685_06785 [Candidatus Angelobacter sp.]